jgi:hypothetical protein
LIAEHEVNVLHWDEAVNAECPYLYCGDADVNDGDRDTSTRRAIVRAVIAKLEAGR